MPKKPASPITPQDKIGVLTTEYKSLYRLAEFRMASLDRRVPAAGAAIVAFMSSVPVLPEPARVVLLAAIPISLIWFVRTTINHARSFEDLLRRIEQIEHAVNKLAGEVLMTFQSSHPSRGRAVGGRTGFETVSAVGLASALLIGACEYLLRWTGPENLWVSMAYTGYLLVIAAYVLVQIRHWMNYRYQNFDSVMPPTEPVAR